MDCQRCGEQTVPALWYGRPASGSGCQQTSE